MVVHSSDFSSTIPPSTVTVSPAHSTSRGETEESGVPEGGGTQGPANVERGEHVPPGDGPALSLVPESAGELVRSDGHHVRAFFH